MGQTGTVTPLSDRRRDIFFIVVFSFFAFSSFFSDAWHALDLLQGDAFWARANRWYAEFAADTYFAAEHDYLRVGLGPAPGETLIFWAFNGPYAVVPILLGVRMWKPNPFGAQ